MMQGLRIAAGELHAYQVEEDTQKSWETALQFREKANLYLEENIFTRQGSDVAGAYSEASKKLKELKSSFEANLTNSRQRRYFARYSLPHAVTLLDRVSRYQTRQLQIAKAQQAESGMQTALEDAKADIDSPEALQFHFNQYNLALSSKLQQLPKELVEPTKREAVSLFHTDVARQMITSAQGEPEETQLSRVDQALEYLKKRKDQIKASEYSSLVGKLKASRRELVASTKARDLLEQGDLDSALKKVEKDGSLGEESKELIKKYLHSYKAKDLQLLRLRDREKLDQFYAELGEDYSEARVRKLFTKYEFSPDVAFSLRTAFERKWEAEKDEKAKIAFKQEAATIYGSILNLYHEDPARFAEEPLDQYRPYFTPTQFYRLKDLQERVKRGEDTWTREVLSEFKKTFDAKMSLLKKTDPDTYNLWFQTASQSVLERAQQIPREKRTRATIFDIVNDSTLGYVVPRSFLGIGFLSRNIEVPKVLLPLATKEYGVPMTETYPTAQTRDFLQKRYGIPTDAEYKPTLGKFYLKGSSVMEYLAMHGLKPYYKDPNTGEEYPIIGLFVDIYGPSQAIVEKNLGVMPVDVSKWRSSRR
jgi:hypothetical protein